MAHFAPESLAHFEPESVAQFVRNIQAIMATIAAESFGTNIRATITTTVPNFVRGSLVLLTILYKGLQQYGIEKLTSVLITGLLCVTVSLLMAWFSEETYGKDLDYLEG